MAKICQKSVSDPFEAHIFILVRRFSVVHNILGGLKNIKFWLKTHGG
jgi:hypothetical protein